MMKKEMGVLRANVLSDVIFILPVPGASCHHYSNEKKAKDVPNSFEEFAFEKVNPAPEVAYL